MNMAAKFLIVGCAALVFSACDGSGSDDDDSPEVPSNPLISATYQACVFGVATRYQFSNEDGAKRVETFAAPDCSGEPLTSVETPFDFSIGGDVTANTGESAWKLDITENGVTTYTIFRLSGGTISADDLNFGAPPPVSSAGLVGTTDATRHDGLDFTVTYERI